MTKKEYIKAHPKSRLAQKMRANNWPDNKSIMIIRGQEAPNMPQSNLYQALCVSALEEYEIDRHHIHLGNKSRWMAVA